MMVADVIRIMGTLGTYVRTSFSGSHEYTLHTNSFYFLQINFDTASVYDNTSMQQ